VRERCGTISFQVFQPYSPANTTATKAPTSIRTSPLDVASQKSAALSSQTESAGAAAAGGLFCTSCAMIAML
jgi:hypothetical protein